MQAHSPRFSRPDNSTINLMVDFDFILDEEFSPYTCSAADDLYGLYARAIAGEFGPIAGFVAPSVTIADVIVERDRRLATGFDFDFGDARGIHRIGTTPADMRGWDEVTAAAQAAINLGSPSSTINIITDTGPATVTALEWQTILAAAAAHRQPIWAAAFAIQAMNPIPADYADDSRWA